MADSAQTSSVLSLVHTVDRERTTGRGQLRLATVNGAGVDNTVSTSAASGSINASAATPRRSLLSRVGQLIMPKSSDMPGVLVDADFWDHRHRS